MSQYILNPTNLQHRRRKKEEKINDLQVVTYANGVGHEVTIVRTGNTSYGTLLFESDDYDVAATFATVFPYLLDREFEFTNGVTRRAFFNAKHPTYLFGSELYDEYRGKLVRFKDDILGQPKGFVKIN